MIFEKSFEVLKSLEFPLCWWEAMASANGGGETMAVPPAFLGPSRLLKYYGSCCCFCSVVGSFVDRIFSAYGSKPAATGARFPP